MIHIITPFSRFENYQFYINHFRSYDDKIIWRPIFHTDSIPKDIKLDSSVKWIEGLYLNHLPKGIHPNIYKIQTFIDYNYIEDDDYYMFMNDDDWIEENVFETIEHLDNPVIFISMKRGDNKPKSRAPGQIIHDISTLTARDNLKAGEIGIEQIIVKGHVLKKLKLENHEMFDGLLAEQLQKQYNILNMPHLFSYFNYLEKGRWNEATTIIDSILLKKN